jgi:outer membrane protein
MAPRHLATPLLALGLTAAPPATGLLAQARPITLDEALRRAEQVDPLVRQAEGNVRNSSAGVRAAYGGYLPTFATSANLSNSFSSGASFVHPVTGEVISGDRSTTGVSFGAQASYDLFTGFRRGKDIASARAQRTSAEAALDYERAQNRLRTTRTFVDAIQSASLVQVRRESIRRAEEQFRIAVAKLATRSVNVDDSLQAAVNVAQAQLQLLSDEQQLEANEAALGRAVGEVGRVSAQADSELTRLASIPDTAALIAEAQAQAPEVLRTEAAERAARANLGAVKAQYFPNLNLSATTQLAGSRTDSLFGSRSVGLGLSWQVFNRFQRELQVARSRSDVATAETQTTDTKRRVAAEMIGRLAALRAAEARYRIARANVETLRALVRVKLERYRIGSIDADLLSRSQEQLNTAESDAVRAQFDYVVRKAEIEAVVGRGL